MSKRLYYNYTSQFYSKDSELYPDPLSESASVDSELELMLDTDNCPSVPVLKRHTHKLDAGLRAY